MPTKQTRTKRPRRASCGCAALGGPQTGRGMSKAKLKKLALALTGTVTVASLAAAKLLMDNMKKQELEAVWI